MKVALSLAVFCVVFGLIACEDCHRTDDCKATGCDGGSHVACLNHVCTCVINHDSCKQDGCSSKDDCSSCSCPNQREEHCVDQHCRCFHGPGRPIGK